jgi:DNA-binding response OmpR family regulator
LPAASFTPLAGRTEPVPDAVQKTILVVDDEHEMRAYLALILEPAGYKVLEAADGQEADHIWSKHEIDLLIADIWLPGMNGVDLAVLLRYRRPSLKVLFLSGFNPRPTAKEMELMGGAQYITKPIDRGPFLEKIRDVLNGAAR